MRNHIAALLLVVTLLSAGCAVSTFQHKTAGMAQEQIARLLVGRNVWVYRIDGEVTGYKDLFSSYYVFLTPGEHELTFQYYDNQSSSAGIAISYSDDATVKHWFAPGQKYYVSTSSGQGQIRFHVRAKGDGGVHPASVPPKADWQPGEVLAPTMAVYARGEPPVIHFRRFPGNAQDWITVVPAGASPNTWGEWSYTKGAREGALVFPVLGPGKYEVRGYHDWPDGGFTIQARATFEVR